MMLVEGANVRAIARPSCGRETAYFRQVFEQLIQELPHGQPFVQRGPPEYPLDDES